MKNMISAVSLEKAVAAESKCYSSCSDYSCVRSGGCTGEAGYKVRELAYQQKREEDERVEFFRIKKLLEKYSLKGGSCGV